MTFFESEQVQTNLQDIFETYQEVASMTSQLGNMDREERLEHIQTLSNGSIVLDQSSGLAEIIIREKILRENFKELFPNAISEDAA